MDQRIPVTILTGFLGAGKTTLLNRLIKDNPQKKFAIIENEFGEIGIDNELVVGVDDGIFELSNGCVCCSLNDELHQVLEKLLNSQHKIDHLIIETTGIADPAPVVMSFLSDYAIQKTFRPDAIITLTDARFIEQQLEDEDIACDQVATADLILISKADLVEPYQLETVTNILKRMNSTARILHSDKGKVEGIDLLDLKAFNRESILAKETGAVFKVDASTASLMPKMAKAPKNSALFAPQHTKKQKHIDITNQSFVFTQALDLLRFDLWMRMLLNHKQIRMYRVKGILNFASIPEKIIFQAVNDQFVSESGGPWGDEEHVSKIVFIGKNLDHDLLENGLNICCSQEEFDPEAFYEQLYGKTFR